MPKWSAGKPPYPTPIDQVAASRAGLAAFHAMAEGGGLLLSDSAGPLTLSATSGTVWSQTPYGPALALSSAGSGASAILPTRLQLGFPMSLAVSIHVNAAPSAQVPILGLMQSSSTTGRAVSIEVNTSLQLVMVSNGTTASASFATLAAGEDHVIAVGIGPAGGWKAFLDGVQVGSGAGLATGTYTATASLCFGAGMSSFSAITPNLLAYWGAVLSRNITANDAFAIGSTPTAGIDQFFSPRRPQLQEIAPPASFSLVASAGNFALTGRASSFGVAIASAKGSYSETGRASSFRVGISAATGHYAETGRAASFRLATVLTASAGHYAATGRPATFNLGGNSTLSVGAGHYALTGRAATFNLTINRSISVDAGHYSLAGHDAHFDRLLAAGAAHYIRSGRNASFIVGGLPSFREAIYAYLASLPGLAAVVGDRIFFTNADRGVVYPFLTFSIPHHLGLHGRHYGQNLDGPDGTSTAQIQFTATSSLESECIDAIRTLDGLEDYSGDMHGVEIMSSNSDMEWDSAIYFVSDQSYVYEANISFRIKHRATPDTA